MTSETTPKIIPLSECQYSAWLPLWQAYLNFYKTTLSEKQINLTWQRLQDANQSDMFGFAIMLNEQAVGIVHLISHSSTWTALPYCYLQDLFVHSDFRNQGLARKLIGFSYKYCEQNYDRVYWLTHETNEDAKLLYNNIATQTGFIQYKKSLN